MVFGDCKISPVLFLLATFTMFKQLFLFSMILIFISKTQALIGVDNYIYDPVDWKCMKDFGYTFTTIDVFVNWTSMNCDNAVATIKQARDAGFSNVDGHLYPNFGLDPGRQIDDQIQCLVKNNVVVDQLWITVWTGNTWPPFIDKNIIYLRKMANEVIKLGYRVGIYTMRSHWDCIMGLSTNFTDTDLWYISLDDKANFNDFQTFGGWTKPIMKSYGSSQSKCVPMHYSLRNVYRETTGSTHAPPVTVSSSTGSTGGSSTKKPTGTSSKNMVNWTIMIVGFLFCIGSF